MSSVFEVKAKRVIDDTNAEFAKGNLGNLSSTAINANLLPDTSGTRSLGSATLKWQDAHVNNIKNTSGILIEAQGGSLDLSVKDTSHLRLLSYDGVNAPQMRFHNAAGTQYAAVRAPALTSSYTLTLPTDDGTSGQVLTTDGSGVLSWTTPSGGTSWVKYTVSHTSLQAAALTNNIELFSLPAKGVIRGIIVKHTTAFAGTGITAYTVSVGISGALQKYSSAFDVYQAVGAGVGQSSSVLDFESFTGATSIRIAATSVGANLDQSTAGSVDVFVLSDTLP